MRTLGWSLGLAIALGAIGGAARAQNPPPAPAQKQAPPALTPPRAPVPPRPSVGARAANRAPTYAPIHPAATPGVPPDSMRPAAATAVAAPPANAVARCRDGTFIVPPGDTSACGTHGGLAVVMPRRSAPPPPAARTTEAQGAVPAVAPADAAAPVGATMRCQDGTYLGGIPSEGACAGHGGLAAALPAARTAPAQPARVRRP